MTLPPTFTLSVERTVWRRYRLSASQVLVGISPERTFSFFEDPRNLFSITPPWLDFRMLEPHRVRTFEGAEFDYRIRWMGLPIPWRSRIVNYHPPREFTDIQIRGPYLRWEHRHTFETHTDGTLMQDRVDYVLPLLALPFHWPIVRGQLEDIFRYRALRIDEWARGTFKSRKEP